MEDMLEGSPISLTSIVKRMEQTKENGLMKESTMANPSMGPGGAGNGGGDGENEGQDGENGEKKLFGDDSDVDGDGLDVKEHDLMTKLVPPAEMSLELPIEMTDVQKRIVKLLKRKDKLRFELHKASQGYAPTTTPYL